jgi:hypothetical protein
MTGLQVVQSHDRRSEATELALVMARLCRDFPEFDSDDVRARVEVKAGDFAGCRVRTFVPLLVERAVRAVLKVEAGTEERRYWSRPEALAEDTG